MDVAINEGIARSGRHTSFHLSAGPVDAVPIIFVHGWPELSVSWRHQLATFASLGFRTIAPDMRGYGRSSRYNRHEDYAVEEIVTDMVELLHSTGAEKAIWVGHDWGSPIVWALASHFPQLCHGVASLCVPYIPNGFATANLIPLVDRTVYPEAEYPAGQWEYWLHYQQNFRDVQGVFDANVDILAKALFRKGDGGPINKRAFTAQVRKKGGWSGLIEATKDLPIDQDVLTEAEFSKYVASLKVNGFFGPDSWYMNDQRNMDYAQKAVNGGRIDLPSLFIAAAHDYTCMTIGTRLGEPMRASCTRLTEEVVHSGHWMAQEKPVEINSMIARWLARELPQLWRG